MATPLRSGQAGCQREWICQDRLEAAADFFDGLGVSESGEVAGGFAEIGRARDAAHELGIAGFREVAHEPDLTGLERLAEAASY